MPRFVRLEAAGHFMNGGEAPLPTAPDRLERKVMLVYSGQFESMDGPVEVKAEDVLRLAEKHNGLLAGIRRFAGGSVPVKDCPPVQLDHSASAAHTVGRLTGDLSVDDLMIEDQPRKALFGTLTILGKENVEKVLDGRWTHVSIGADLETGKLNELSITPFPAAANAAMLAKRTRFGRIVKIVEYKGVMIEVEQIGDSYTASYGSSTTDLYPSASAALDAARKSIDRGVGMSSRLAASRCSVEALNGGLFEVKNPDRVPIEGSPFKTREEAEQAAEQYSERATGAFRASKGEGMDKEKLKKHLMEKEKLSAEDADKKLASMSDEECKHLAKEADEHEKKLAAEKTEEEEKQKKAEMTARREKLVTLSKGLRSKQAGISLAAKKASISTRLSALRAEAKITPAEIKKMDLDKLAGESEAVVEATLSAYANREPVIFTGALGSQKGENVAALSQAYKSEKLLLETALNMPSKRADAEKRLAALNSDYQAKIAKLSEGGTVIHIDTAGHSHNDVYGELCKMLDEGKDVAAFKARLKQVLSEARVSMTMSADDSEKRLTALAGEVKAVQDQVNEVIALAGAALGVEAKDLE